MKRVLSASFLAVTCLLAKTPARSPIKARIAWAEEATKGNQAARDLAHMHHQANAEDFNVNCKATDKDSDTLLLFRPTTNWTKASAAQCLNNNGPVWRQLGFQKIIFIHTNLKTFKPEVSGSFKIEDPKP